MLSNTTDKYIYQGNGSSTTFTIAHQIIVSDINETLVYLRDETNPANPITTLQTYGALQQYTLSGANPPSIPFNNMVVMNVAPTSNQKLIICRSMPLTEILNLVTGQDFDFANTQVELERIVAMIQELYEITTRCAALTIATTKTQLIIPEPQPNTVLGFDSQSNPLMVLYPSPLSGLLPTPVESQVSLADNTSGQSLTGFSVAATVYSMMTLRYSIMRSSTNGTLRETGWIVLTYDNTNSVWRIANPTFGPDVGGLTFSVSTTGGVGSLTVATDAMSLGGSSFVNKMRYKVIDYAGVEV